MDKDDIGGTDLAELSAALKKGGLDRPAVVLDLDALDHNIAILKKTADPRLAWRLVAKSLPSEPLIRYLQNALGTRKLMVFSDPMLSQLLSGTPTDVLMGRPMLISSVRRVLGCYPKATHQVQWLVDSFARLEEYRELAAELGTPLRLNLEIDVGLHRGGFAIEDIARLDTAFRNCKELKLAGLMGYEPHLSKLPSVLAAVSEKRFEKTYGAFVRWARSMGGEFCFNTGGSLTFHKYQSGGSINEVSFGSVMVLPTDFKSSASLGFVPAAYVATPILKVLPSNPWPGLDVLSGLRRRTMDVAIQGGYFMGEPIYPCKFGYSGIFGRSSNQEIWSGRSKAGLAPGDIALLRPSQSELVLNSLGSMLAYRRDQGLSEWPVLPH
ncbi:hypothetical protein TRL7639_04561 [Falsiruegeria litorea R37]|uniref:Alanine racemase N-terminal domain-containing protein n=1 Tax=Falsiruegeria litorea R37 TaxID=1200284 RepID=A0A1Y5TW25_9RHOB|nr:alanine racemase [Falsiruegeria litorea]SLN74749.1 hypothetical protein TRL7639_04561 [Falsiruegeria litorea R37]